ncbi:hypothetical protein [Pseudofrankia sp. BMG5.37]|uniref:hypothetical protein n=1 Tax=Pseudofrankia sp. BMG5.37 TaxID=3050035 RepID=UPI0028949C22|nr:hypothetical protein [Pseudofrankia sp. BMG5.37]MDT3438328.1 hypothetical protein [Pseudofrankia sp. BMG5.37]
MPPKRRTQGDRDAAVRAAHEDNVANQADNAEQWGADLSTLTPEQQEQVRLAREARDGRSTT